MIAYAKMSAEERKVEYARLQKEFEELKASGLNLAGYKKYLNQVRLMYNGSSRKNALPQKY